MTFLKRFAFAILVLVIPPLANAQPAQITEDDLYKAETIVTGTQEPERLRGFAVGAEEVLIKLTGRADWAKGDRAKKVIAQAPDMITDYSYEDRMKDIPVHDEQGTRDRPHFLRMTFDKAKFNAALSEARLERWIAKRPLVAVWLVVREAKKKYILGRDGDDGYLQREVFKEASVKRGIPIILPEAVQENVTIQNIEKSNWSVLRRASADLGAKTVLYGVLDFDGDTAWDVRWTLAGHGAYAKWREKGVTFDRALKGALERTAAAHAKREG